MSFLSIFQDDVDESLRRTALLEEIRQAEGPPPGRWGYVTHEDLARTRRLIIHGYDNEPPLKCWRW